MPTDMGERKPYRPHKLLFGFINQNDIWSFLLQNRDTLPPFTTYNPSRVATRIAFLFRRQDPN